MVSTFTPNINIEEPARGDDVGTWDTPVNNNMTLIDLVLGGNATISVSAGSLNLSAAQFQCRMLTFNSTLLSNTTVTFPSTFKKDYIVLNAATGSSQFTLTLATTAGGTAQIIGIPPGDAVSVYNDGSNINFLNLGRVGSYIDIIASSMPNWVDASSPKKPYLNCDGTTFSSATYPQLTSLLGSTTTPDARGRTRFALDQSAGRISSAAGGFSGSSVGASGGAQTLTLSASNIPTLSAANTITVYPSGNSGYYVPYYTSASWTPFNFNVGAGGSYYSPALFSALTLQINSFSASNTVTVGTSNNTAISELPPAVIHGLTLVRAG